MMLLLAARRGGAASARGGGITLARAVHAEAAVGGGGAAQRVSDAFARAARRERENQDDEEGEERGGMKGGRRGRRERGHMSHPRQQQHGRKHQHREQMMMIEQEQQQQHQSFVQYSQRVHAAMRDEGALGSALGGASGFGMGADTMPSGGPRLSMGQAGMGLPVHTDPEQLAKGVRRDRRETQQQWRRRERVEKLGIADIGGRIRDEVPSRAQLRQQAGGGGDRSGIGGGRRAGRGAGGEGLEKGRQDQYRARAVAKAKGKLRASRTKNDHHRKKTKRDQDQSDRKHMSKKGKKRAQQLLQEEKERQRQQLLRQQEQQEPDDEERLRLLLERPHDRRSTLRPPVISVMGHVDHGKTSMLDRLRNASVAAKEHGGITQRVAAFSLPLTGTDASVEAATFLDTPGHAAFKKMRAHGANAVDLAVLVVAADDGIAEQTKESIAMIKAAKVPLMVLVTKIDLVVDDEDDTEAREIVLQHIADALSMHGVDTERVGGDVVMLPFSSLTGEGVEDFKQLLALQAEMLELRAPETGPADGVLIECGMLPGAGAYADVLVRSGEVRTGDWVTVGSSYGRVKRMLDVESRTVKRAGPSEGVRIIGLRSLPGEESASQFHVLPSEAIAREVTVLTQRVHSTESAIDVDPSSNLNATQADSRLRTQRAEQLEREKSRLQRMINYGHAPRSGRMKAMHEAVVSGRIALDDITLDFFDSNSPAASDAAGGRDAAGAEEPAAVVAGATKAATAGEGADPTGEQAVVYAIVKAGGRASLDAVCDALHGLQGLSQDMAKVVITHASVGTVSATDVDVAATTAAAASSALDSTHDAGAVNDSNGRNGVSNGESAAEDRTVLFAFDTGVERGGVRKHADQNNVTIAEHNVIYHLVDEAKQMLQESMPVEEVFQHRGKAKVQKLFPLNDKHRTVVAGCKVEDGEVAVEHVFRVTRNGQEVVARSPATALRHLKDDVPRVAAPMECGLALKLHHLVREGDQIEALAVKREQVRIAWSDEAQHQHQHKHDAGGIQSMYPRA